MSAVFSESKGKPFYVSTSPDAPLELALLVAASGKASMLEKPVACVLDESAAIMGQCIAVLLCDIHVVEDAVDYFGVVG